MKSIFVSHAWKEDETYTDFLEMLTEVLENKQWKNVSVPKDDAIELSDEKKRLDEISEIENEIFRVDAKIQSSGLPDVASRVVWDEHGNRKEVETLAPIQ